MYAGRASALPDISVIAFSADESALEPGEILHLHWIIQNQGTSQAAGVWHDQLGISPDGVSGNDTALATHGYFVVLNPTESVMITYGLSIPPDTPIGEYWIVVRLNYLGELTESSYSNNYAIVCPIKVTGPNLIVSDISLLSTPADPGDTFKVQWRTTNISPDLDATGAWRDTVYLTSTHPFFREVELATYAYFTTMDPGEFVEFTRTVTIPSDIWAGEYCIKVCTDVEGKLIETNEYDNFKSECGIYLNGTQAPAFSIGRWSLIMLCIMIVAYILYGGKLSPDKP